MGVLRERVAAEEQANTRYINIPMSTMLVTPWSSLFSCLVLSRVPSLISVSPTPVPRLGCLDRQS